MLIGKHGSERGGKTQNSCRTAAQAGASQGGLLTRDSLNLRRVSNIHHWNIGHPGCIDKGLHTPPAVTKDSRCISAFHRIDIVHCGCKVIDACRVQTGSAICSVPSWSLLVQIGQQERVTLREAWNLLNSTAFTCAQKPSDESGQLTEPVALTEVGLPTLDLALRSSNAAKTKQD